MGGADAVDRSRPGAPPSALAVSRRRRWCVAFVVVGGLISAWVLATPVFASPDEPSHLVHAIGVAHGEWLGHRFRPGHGEQPPVRGIRKAALFVTVPRVYRDGAKISCLAFKPDVTASCLDLKSSNGSAPAVTYTGRYFPAYYLAVGSVSWVTSAGAHQVYLMRLIGALVSAALLASAILTVLEAAPSPLALTGLALAVTPMTLFIAASINPNGLEIAAAVGVWVHGTAIVTGRLPLVGERLITRLGVAATVLALNRPTSLLWLALIGAVLLVCAGRRTIGELVRRRSVRWWGAALSVAVALQLGWSVWAGAFRPSQTFTGYPVSATASEFARTTVGQGYGLLRQMIGVFGWADTPAPTLTLVLWLFGLGALVGVAIVVAPRLLRALAATVVLVVVVPIAVQASYVHDIGYVWQGRYSLPLAAGVPILAGMGIALGQDRWPDPRRVAVPIVTGLAVAQFLAFAQALRRYTVGANGTIWFPWNAQWQPPVPILVLLVGFAGILAVASALVVRTGAEPVVAGRDPGRGDRAGQSVDDAPESTSR